MTGKDFWRLVTIAALGSLIASVLYIFIAPFFTNQKPVADFDFTPTSPGVNETVSFNDSSRDPDGSVRDWMWDYGDGSTAVGKNPQHYFNTSGSFNVCLTVRDDKGSLSEPACQWASIASASVTAPSNQKPVADFSISNSSPTVNQVVEFYDRSVDYDGSIISWYWDFGNGLSSQAKNPTSTFRSSGSQTICLIVKDDKGTSSERDCKPINVEIVQTTNREPIPSFQFSPSKPEEGQAVSFTDMSYDPDGSIASWAWDFGDDNYSNSRNPSHVFRSSGSWQVCLRVTDDRRAGAATCQGIYVSSIPQPPQPPQSSQGATVTLSDAVRLSGQFYYVNSNPAKVNELEIFAFYLPNPQGKPGKVIPYSSSLGGFALPPSDMVFGFRKSNASPELWVLLSPDSVSISGSVKWNQASSGAWNLQTE